MSDQTDDWANNRLFSVLEKLPASKKIIGRLGGSDFDAVVYHSANISQKIRTTLETRIVPTSHRKRTQRLNGFFVSMTSNLSPGQQYRNYLRTIEKSWEYSDISLIPQPLLNKAETHFAGSYSSQRAQRASKDWLPFTRLERLTPLIRAMSNWPSGTRLLVVSPFSSSISHQSKRLHRTLNGYDLSHLRISTVTTPVTYSSGAGVVSDETWVDISKRIIEDVANSHFDVCFASCGSYANPLLASLAKSGKPGLYLGGLLQPLMNLKSARYSTPYYESFGIEETRLIPFESEELRKVSAGFWLKNEALRAYLPTLE